MAWNPQGGSGGPFGGGGGQGPWGRGPQGPQRPPDIDELLRKSQDKVKKFLPGGFGGGRAIILVLIAIFGLWMASGFYRVQPDEQGVVLWFGKWQQTTGPGLHWNFPPPVGEVYNPKVTTVNSVKVGYVDNGSGTATRSVPRESLMLTGDENIIDVQSAVFWIIKDAGQFLFNIRNPEGTVKDASEAALREIIGRSEFEFARTQGRGKIAAEAKELIQSILDSYEAGIEITEVKLQNINPPANVLDAFRDVQAAQADRERAINEANAYFNEILQRAEGESQRIIKGAEGYKEQKIAQATGEASRFLALHQQYLKEKDVTRRRIYVDVMKDIMAGMDKVLINGKDGAGVVPYLPLDQLTKSKQGGQ